MILDPWFYLAAAVAVLIVGMAKGGFGGGIGIVGVPLMATVVSPAQAAAILLPLLMVMDALAVRAYRGRWNWSHLRVLVPASLIGTALGFLTFRSFSPDGLRVLVALVALVYAAQYFIHRPSAEARPPHTGAGLFWGITAGFTSFSIHAGGPPLQAYLLPQRMDRTTFQATSVLFFFVLNWSKVVPYAWLDLWQTRNLATSLVLLPLAPAGIFLGRWLHHRVNDQLFFRVVHASLFVIGVKLLYDALATT